MIITVVRNGSQVTVRIKNDGPNIVMIQKLKLKFTGGGLSELDLYPGQPAWAYSSAFLPQGVEALFYDGAPPGGPVNSAQAIAEFIEIDRRERSPVV